MLSQLDSNYSNPSKLGASDEKMEIEGSGCSNEAAGSDTVKKEGVKLDLPTGEGVKNDAIEDESEVKAGEESPAKEVTATASSSSSSTSSSSSNNESGKKTSAKDEVADDKSDSDDNSSDSDSSSSSLSSPNPNSSQEEDEEEDDDKAVEPKVPKPRLSSATNSQRGSVSTFHQMSISLYSSHHIPESGIFDPEFTELADQFALKVLEYLEEVCDRLFTARLHNEVRRGLK